ncbi:metal ABC transporter substrate-binding protein [Phreatobacter aquaticus]|uniref:Metal ABC transporter substrate-binding protein n=1 Tax=Phreatobacter aquaticus TaxID=2570229 RepID=A0A4D7QKH0_9HYPH|nr:ABC transporter substrate-binding protein [Phreatobacter aquaticus]QCK85737.1 metal ABC transporter substrate-binding protein [Phreatobacter aquaticus]
MINLTRRHFAGGLAAGSAIVASPAFAQAPTKVTLGYTAVADFTSAFVAQEEGYFRKRGLDVGFQLIALNSNIPAAMQADSVQIGGPTASVMLQANDGGLDLVAIAGASVTARDVANYGFVERTGAGITDAKSAEGKRIGVPGLGAFLHVLFRKWMAEKGADWKKVTFVETPFPQMPDILRGGSVDGLITGSPIMERIVQGNIGRVVSYFHTELPAGLPAVIYSTTRAWATKNPALLKAFREGVAEGVAFVNDKANDSRVRAIIGKYIPLPPAVIATAIITRQKADITVEEINYWITIMKEQDMLRGQPVAANVVLP